VTEDVAPDALAIGRGRQVAKDGWAKAFRDEKSAMKRSGKKPKGAV
jgi:bifunctional UDP-N-acetylglucosamine pyrophosphorylase/glucosamine-1-phosphate N-acetyltransferase